MDPRRSPIDRPRIGQLLVDRGALSPEQLDEVLTAQSAGATRLASACFLRRLVSEEAAVGPLSAQRGVPGVLLTRLVLPLAFLDAVPESVALDRSVLPIRVDKERIFVAMADPQHEEAANEVAFVNGRRVLPCVALHAVLRDLIVRAYAAKKRGELELRAPGAAPQPAMEQQLPLVFSDNLSEVPETLTAPVTGGFRAATAEVQAVSAELAQAARASSLAGAESAARPTRHPRVLVVEDDEELRRLIVRLLRGEGMEVDEAARGLEALARIRQSPPNLLILDAMLPEVHGFDIARKVSSSDRYAHIPIIMMSSVYGGWRIAEDLKQSYGVAAFLEKPFKINELWTTVKRVMGRRARRPSGTHRMAASAEQAYRDGIGAYKKGDLDGAIERLREGLHIDPLSAKLHFHLGVLCLKKKGMIYQAMHAFEEAVALDPELFAALRSLAILYQRKGFKNKAIDMWERALHCSPSDDMSEEIRSHLVKLLD